MNLNRGSSYDTHPQGTKTENAQEKKNVSKRRGSFWE